MSKRIVNFGDKKFDKSNFYKNKKLFKIDNIDVDKILISKKEPYGKEKSYKYFISYNDNDNIRPLCVKLPKMIGYVKCFDNAKTMSFKFAHNKLQKKSIKIWERVNNLMNIKFDSEPVYGGSDKYIKTKLKAYGDKINTNFQGKKMLKENVPHKRFSLTVLDPGIRTNKKYYPQTLLEECKYEL